MEAQWICRNAERTLEHGLGGKASTSGLDKCYPCPYPEERQPACGGIALLNVVGKLVARIVQSRLQVVAEKVLPESQCGFRRGRGCTDMIFVIRQLVEKAVEHQAVQHFVFVDLKKAYDSVAGGKCG